MDRVKLVDIVEYWPHDLRKSERERERERVGEREGERVGERERVRIR
jgi:hypothetical protein